MPTTGYQSGDIPHSPRYVADNDPVLIHGEVFQCRRCEVEWCPGRDES